MHVNHVTFYAAYCIKQYNTLLQMQKNRALWFICCVVLVVQLLSWTQVTSRMVMISDFSQIDVMPEYESSTAYQVSHPDYVSIDSAYALDHWGIVNFKPVPEYKIDTHDPVSQDIYISGSVHSKRVWDSFVWDKLVFILNDMPVGHTPVMVDVGANIGYFSLAALALGARVIAFEPMSRNARKLSKSIFRNNFQNSITLYQNAVWDDGPSTLLRLEATSNTNQGNGKVSSSDSVARGVYGVDFVNTVALSDVVRQDVDVMKIDTEGTEGAVIAGARRLICRFKVKFIIMEFTDIRNRRDTYSAENMLKFMNSAGYVVSDITPDAPSLSIADYMNFPPNILFSLNQEKAYCG